MMATLDDVRRHCHISEDEEELLASQQCPIVLLRWRPESTVVPSVAPNNRYLGVMLPYTPLHHVLLRDVDRPLVMTSGNLSEEPIAQTNEQGPAAPRSPGRRLPATQPRHLCPLRRLGLVQPGCRFQPAPAHSQVAGVCSIPHSPAL